MVRSSLQETSRFPLWSKAIDQTSEKENVTITVHVQPRRQKIRGSIWPFLDSYRRSVAGEGFRTTPIISIVFEELNSIVVTT